MADRHNIAVNFNKTIIEKYEKHIPIGFIHDDIISFDSLNGVSKIYMYDKVFDPDLMEKISMIINNTCTIQLIATTRNLVDVTNY